MSTFGRGVRLDFEQLSIGSSVTTDQILIDVPTTANYFVWINHLYSVVTATNNIGTLFFSVDKNKSTSSNTVIHNFNNSDLEEERDFLLGQNTVRVQTSPDAFDDFTQRIIYPGQQLRVVGANSSGIETAFLYYSKVYFGGQANV